MKEDDGKTFIGAVSSRLPDLGVRFRFREGLFRLAAEDLAAVAEVPPAAGGLLALLVMIVLAAGAQ